jgi:hypothetical protein
VSSTALQSRSYLRGTYGYYYLMILLFDSTAKTGCLTPMGVFNSKNCLEQIAQKVLFQLKIANLDLHYYGFVFVNLNLGIISLLLAFSASLACPEPSGKTA